ncbi:MAG: Arsenate reductase thioredoxin-coupled, partial [uncultured Rubrobacteraceae bacterium]
EQDPRPLSLHAQLRPLPDGRGAPAPPRRGPVRGPQRRHRGHEHPPARGAGDGRDRGGHLGSGVQDPRSVPGRALRLRSHRLRRCERGMPRLPRREGAPPLVLPRPVAGDRHRRRTPRGLSSGARRDPRPHGKGATL